MNIDQNDPISKTIMAPNLENSDEGCYSNLQLGFHQNDSFMYFSLLAPKYLISEKST